MLRFPAASHIVIDTARRTVSDSVNELLQLLRRAPDQLA